MNFNNLLYLALSLFTLTSSNEYTEQLKDMIAQENHNQIMRLIDKGADINTTDDRGYTALIIAAKNKDNNFLSWLLERHADLDTQTPWDQPHVGKPALSFALEKTNHDAVKLLVDAGANVNLYNDRGTAANMLALPGGLRQRNNPLLIYAIGRHLPMPFINTLLSAQNVDVNKPSLLYPVTALMIAAATGYEEAVKVLLHAGADKEVINTLDNKKAIDYASDAGHTNIVKLLKNN